MRVKTVSISAGCGESVILPICKGGFGGCQLFVVIEHKRELSRNIVNKEIELKLGIAGKLE